MSWARAEVSSHFALHLRFLLGSCVAVPAEMVLTWVVVGVYAPGYEERRAQRIKEAYNIDVPPPASRMAS